MRNIIEGKDGTIYYSHDSVLNLMRTARETERARIVEMIQRMTTG